MNIRIMILRIGKVVLKCIYGFMKLRPMKNRITILSRQSDEPTVDIALLACYLEENHPDLDVRVLCRKLEGGSALGYGAHMLRQMWNMANSKVILLDSYCIAASILDHRKGAEVVQMWHSMAAIKQFGYQSLGRAGGRSPQVAEVLCMHRNYDHILCPSKVTGEWFCRAFDAEVSKMILMALPRVDIILSEKEDGAALRREYGIDDDKEMILYAPTFRKNGQLKIDELTSGLDRSRYTMIICPHPLDDSPCLEDEKLTADASVIVDREKGSLSWLPECDRVVTDYSAVSVEAAIAGKPLYFYVYDIDRYMEDEGLNMDPRSECPRITAETGKRLSELMDEGYPEEELADFRRRYFEADGTNCTKKLGEYIYGLAQKDN